MNITRARLVDVLSYDPLSGDFAWIADTGRARAGSAAGSRHSTGYVYIKVDGKRYLAHRLAWFYSYAAWPNELIDHINGDRADNRICNLREVTRTGNAQNIYRPNADSKTGMLGVTWIKGRNLWGAQIKAHGKNIHLGAYETQEAAHRAYVEAKRQLHPFGNL